MKSVNHKTLNLFWKLYYFTLPTNQFKYEKICLKADGGK